MSEDYRRYLLTEIEAEKGLYKKLDSILFSKQGITDYFAVENSMKIKMVIISGFSRNFS